MKFPTIPSIICFAMMLSAVSCNKQIKDQVSVKPVSPRTVQFVLWTDSDFSSHDEQIVFTLSIRRRTNEILWDSLLPPMKVKDIPDLAHKLIIEKIVPNNDSSTLVVGFLYAIENVGNSWFLDKIEQGETFKTINFNFR